MGTTWLISTATLEIVQVEEILARLAQRQEADPKASSERLMVLEQLTQSNSDARAIQAMAAQMAS